MLTVVSAASNYRLATRAAVQAAIAGLSNDAADALLDTASATIAGYCRRVFVAETVRETFRFLSSPRGHRLLRLARYPVQSVSSVTIDGIALTTFEFETGSGSLYRLESDERVCWHGRKIVVDYVGGFPADAVPADLAHACVTLCVAMHAAVGRDPTVRSENVPDVGSVSYRDPDNGGGAIPEAVRSLIDGYREVSL